MLISKKQNNIKDKKISILKYIMFIFSFMIIFSWINNSYWYLDQYEQYKKLWTNILKIPYDEYHNNRINEKYKNSQEYKELENLVKIDTVFDVSAKELETKVTERKNKILTKLREKDIWEVGNKDIDSEISKLEQNGRYLLLELPWQLITITDWEYIYIHKHKIVWNVDVVAKIQDVFNKYRNKENVINTPIAFKKDLIDVLNQYSIKYIEIKWYSIPVTIYIWKNNNKKTSKDTWFFISKWFTTPYLEEQYEVKNPWKAYIWKYLTEDDISYLYNVKDDTRSGSEIYVKSDLLWDIVYMWMVAEKEKIQMNTILWWKLDLFAYKVEQNIYEYIIFFIIIIMWWLLWFYLTHNFVTNYRSNFKRIPEEL